jgi:hypothetical protein
MALTVGPERIDADLSAWTASFTKGVKEGRILMIAGLRKKGGTAG